MSVRITIDIIGSITADTVKTFNSQLEEDVYNCIAYGDDVTDVKVKDVIECNNEGK